MWGLSNIREYKSLSSFFVQFCFNRKLFPNNFKTVFLTNKSHIFFKPSTMFYENKTWASRILESISPFSLSSYSFSLYRKLLSKQTFKQFFKPRVCKQNNQPCFMK